jgi:hypothetical protein
MFSNRRLRFSYRFFQILLVAGIAGCAGASVAPEINHVPVNDSRPSTVYVYPFAVTVSEVTLNQGFFQRTYANLSDENQSQSELQLAHQTAQDLATAITRELETLGFTATQVARGQQVSGENILIVDGQFTDINQGNKLRRMVIGLGMGQSTLDTQVQVYQMANGNTQQIMDFTTHADSGSMPGAAIMGAPGAAVGGAAAIASVGVNVAAGGIKNYTSGMGSLSKKSADEAVAYMSQYFVTQTWIPQSMVKDPKLAGTPNFGL